MMQGTYYKEWSRFLGRDMEFKVYGTGGVPVLAFPCRGGRFYDWENNAMPDAAAQLLAGGKVQLFCADSIDGESLLDGSLTARRRAEMQEKYFGYLTLELAPRILALNRAAQKPADKATAQPEEAAEEAAARIWCVGADFGAYQAVNCRLRRPELFAGAIALSGSYDAAAWFGAPTDDLALRNSPLAYLAQEGFVPAAAKEGGEAILLCAGQGAYEEEALASTRALDAALKAAGVPVHTEEWGGDVSHDWYWWAKEWGLFSARIFG